jgi:hypothetical protein
MRARGLRLAVIAKSINLRQLERPRLIVKQSRCAHKRHRAFDGKYMTSPISAIGSGSKERHAIGGCGLIDDNFHRTGC